MEHEVRRRIRYTIDVFEGGGFRVVGPNGEKGIEITYDRLMEYLKAHHVTTFETTPFSTYMEINPRTVIIGGVAIQIP